MSSRFDDYVRDQVNEALVGALHPEFGTEWREPDGVIYKAVQQARADARREVLAEVERRVSDLRKYDEYAEGAAAAFRIVRGVAEAGEPDA